MSDNNEKESATVLVTDDSRSLRSYLCGILREAGYRTVQAQDGAECLASLEAAIPDIALLDVEMPGLSGLEVLERIGLTPRTFAIILCTTRSDPEQVTAGLDLGADDYIVKPFREGELLARVRAAVRRSQQMRALAEARRGADDALLQLRVAQRRLVEGEKATALAHLAAGAAHHINNPLGFVMSNLATLERYSRLLLGYADRLAGQLGGSEETLRLMREAERELRIPRIRKDLFNLLDETRQGGERIALIVGQLAQLELGLRNQVMAELGVAETVRPLVSQLKELAPAGTELRWEEGPAELAIVGSLPLLNTALVALLNNACEALEGRPGEIAVRVVRAEEHARISITNSGLLPELPVERLFEPFFSTKSPERHVGLGLTIAQRFISFHGGQLSLACHPPAVCATVEIPVCPASTAAGLL